MKEHRKKGDGPLGEVWPAALYAGEDGVVTARDRHGKIIPLLCGPWRRMQKVLWAAVWPNTHYFIMGTGEDTAILVTFRQFVEYLRKHVGTTPHSPPGR